MKRHCMSIHGIGLSAVIGLTATWFLVAVQPMLNASQRVAALGRESSEIRNVVHELIQERDRRSTQLVAVERELAETAIRLRPASAVNAQLAELTRLAEREGIAVERIEPGSAVDTPLAIRVPMRFVGRGSSPSAVRFLAALSESFPDVSVEAFEVRSTEQETTAAVQFDCVWYADRATERPTTAAVNP